MPQMYCSLEGLLYSPYPPLPVWTFPHLPPGASMTREILAARGNCVGKNWPVILSEIATSTSVQGSFTCRKSATWDRWLYFSSEGRCAEELLALKNPDGFGRVSTRELGYLKAARYP